MIQVQRILVPLDFSRHADSVLEWAAHLAEEHQSRLLLLHAYHLPVEFQQLEGAYLPQDFCASVKTEAEQNLKRLAEPLRAKGPPTVAYGRGSRSSHEGFVTSKRYRTSGQRETAAYPPYPRVVSEAATGLPLAGVVVRAFDKDLVSDDTSEARPPTPRGAMKCAFRSKPFGTSPSGGRTSTSASST
jgi:hypothetical protein